MNQTPPPAANHEDDYELPIEGFKGTPEEIERQWFEKVYKRRGANTPQLTVRAVVMGLILGGALSTTNVYVGLKSGWLLGVAITACIMSYALWTTFFKLGLVGSQMSILENNCMQSTASSAGYSTGGTLVSAFSAYIMINHNEIVPLPLMLGWVFLLAVLGVTMAIPMKRQMINVEQLRFPSGIAAAETLRALHSHGEKGRRAAKALGIAGVLAAISDFWSEGVHLISAKLEPFSLDAIVGKANDHLLGKEWIGRTVQLQWDPVFIAAGAISGMRVGVSMIIGGTLCWAVFVPSLQNQGIIAGTGYRVLVGWTIWGGVACMLTSSLVAFLAQWRSIVRALQGLGSMFNRNAPKDEMDAIEPPMSWFFAGQIFGWAGLSILAHYTLKMPLWQTTVAVILSFFLALVACRVTGETDTTPMGAMGKVTQLTFGWLSPRNMNVNLMAANITAASAASSADLLTDLKSGYLLGANPRKQFLAQFFGIFIGTVTTVLAYRVIIGPHAEALGGAKFGAPAAQAWKAIAEALSKGFETMEPIKVKSMVIGGIVGIILPVLGFIFPKHEKYIPSAGALGLAWTFQWYYSFLFFVGAVISWIYTKSAPKSSEEFTFPIASGLIAGAALMGVAVVFADRILGN